MCNFQRLHVNFDSLANLWESEDCSVTSVIVDGLSVVLLSEYSIIKKKKNLLRIN